MACARNYLTKQKVQTQDASSSTPSIVAVNKLYLSNIKHKGILIATIEEEWNFENKMKLKHPDNFGFLQLNYKGFNFHDYFPSNATVKVNEILLKKSSTQKEKSWKNIHKDVLSSDDWDIIHIITKKESDCNYLFEKAIKDNYTVILAILLEIVDANNSSQQLTLYLHGDYGTPLHRAVEEKDIKTIKALLRCNLDINTRNKFGWTPLHVAVDSEIPNVVDFLISNGADVNVQNNECQVPLHFAAKKNNLKILDSLFKSQAKLDKQDTIGRTPLFYAVNAGNVNVVYILLKKGTNYKLTDELNYTAFHLASQRKCLSFIKVFLKNKVDADVLNSRGQTPLFYVSHKPFYPPPEAVHKKAYSKIIDAFLQKGANINFQDLKGRTPLHVGVMNNNIEFVQALLEHNADATIRNKFGRNVLHEACQWSRNKCIQVLLNFNIDIDVVDITGKTALHVAVQEENLNAVELLLKKNPNINVSDSLGKTALHMAIESGCLPIIELLLKNKADVNLKDSFGRTALHLALENPNITIKIIKFILNSTNDINAVDADERTVLHVAVEAKKYTFVKLILKKNPNIDTRDELGKTALHLALESYCSSIIELLLKKKADVNVKDASKKTALHLVSENPNITINIIKSILNSTSDIDAKDDFRRTAVHHAALNHNVCILKYLLEKNADVNAKDSEGKTPLYLAMDPRNEYKLCFECVKILVDYKADINAVDVDLISVLHLACWAKNVKVIKYLIENGADSRMRDKDGKTVFHYACMPQFNDCNMEEDVKDILNILVEENISVNCVDIFGKTALHYAAEGNNLLMNELLLNVGADINIVDKNHNLAFDKSIELNSFSAYIRVKRYMRHIVKLKVMKLWVQKRYLDKIYEVNDESHLEWIQNYEGVCNKEIDLMKSTNLDQSNITYYDFFKKSPHDAVNYTHNQNIVKAIQSNELITRFPIYGHFLKCHLREVQRRSYLYDQIQESLKPCIFKKLPTLCINEVLKYLDNSELHILLEAMIPFVLVK